MNDYAKNGAKKMPSLMVIRQESTAPRTIKALKVSANKYIS
jgi:hypothetical protein